MSRNWLLGRHIYRRDALAGGLPHDSGGRSAGRKAARRVLRGSLSVVIAVAVAGCSGSPGSSGQPRATAAAPLSSVFVSRTVPGTQVGTQLSWFLRAEADMPLPRRVIQAHFDSRFLRQVGPDRVNSVRLALGPSGGSLIGVVSEDPRQHPVGLAAVASFGGARWTVAISVDGAGLISGLQLSPYRPPPVMIRWAQIDRELAALAPDASFLAARVTPGGNCVPVHQVAASAARPLASMFKLFVLGALTHQITTGRISWNQQLTVTNALKSTGEAGPGYLQNDRPGTRVPVQQAAVKMISISDNTAADMLIHLVGRAAVQAQVQQWSDHAALDVPFLTTREAFLLKYLHPALAAKYLSLAPARRPAFLASSVDPLPLSQAQLLHQLQASHAPRDIGTIEWFASPDDICRAFAGLQRLAAQPTLAPLGSVLSASDGGIGLSPAQWPTVWFKGGSEPGVLTLGYLAANNKGQTFVVVAMLGNPIAVLPPSATLGLLAVTRAAFRLAG